MDRAVELQLKNAEIASKLRGSLMLFTRFFFPILTGRDFIISNPVGRESHFITIWKALAKCTRLETNKLVINVPPGHGKSVMVCFWIAWCMAKYPDSNFLYISYSKSLAATHTETIKRIMSLRQYQLLFNVHLREDSQAKDAFTTEAGGVVAAFGSGGGITGRNSGLPGLNRFSGATVCFDYNQLVHTEIGPIKIGEIVDKKLGVKVYSVDLNTMEVQLKPIIGYFQNPGSPIIEVGFSDGATLRCTPEHKIWTDNRGWVEAQSLLVSDKLPSPSPDCTLGKSKQRSGFSLTYRQVFDNIKLVFSKLGKLIRNNTLPFNSPSFFGFARSISTSPNFLNNDIRRIKFCSNLFSREIAHDHIDNIFSRESGTRMSFSHGKSSMFNSILHVIGFSSITKIFKSIIQSIPVYMSNFNSFSLRANKSPSDNSMNTISIINSFFSKRCRPIFSILFRNFFNLLRVNPLTSIISVVNGSHFASNPTKIRGTIKFLKPRNRSPFFIRNVGHVDKSFCINVKDHNNFFVGESEDICILVHNCDDMHKPDEVSSDLIREGVINNYKETIQQRPRGINVPTIFIGQRLHEQDLPSYFLAGEDGHHWERVILKSIDEAGNALYPEAFPLDMLMIRQEKDRYVFASQHQQDPQPAGGGLYLPDDFPLLADEPEFLMTFITADTAETEDPRNDATVFSFWGYYNIMLNGEKTGVMGLHWINCVELRVEPKKLEQEFLDFWKECARHKTPPAVAFIEKKSTGVTLISILKGMRGLKIREIERTRKSGSKSQRFIDIQPYIAAKQVSLPAHGDHSSMCVNHMKKITNNDSHAHDDICFIAGTLIATPFGNKPIEEIRIGDKVLTPMGIGIVFAAGITNHNAKVISNLGLIGTPNHPIFSDASFKRLDTISDAANISSLTLKGLIQWKYRKLLYSMTSNIDSWGREDIILASHVSLKDDKVLKDFMSRFMSFIAALKFQKAMWFIIKMATALITTTVIWNVFRTSNIWKGIAKRNPFMHALNRIREIFIKPSLPLENGTPVKKAFHGIVKMLRQAYISLKTMFAKNVERTIFAQQAFVQSSVESHVMAGIEDDICQKSHLNALNVEQNLNARNPQANIPNADTAQDHAQAELQTAVVYNLTVEGYGVYYANGILVSNCDTATDAVRIALMDKMLYGYTHKDALFRSKTLEAAGRFSYINSLKNKAYTQRI